MTTSLLLLLALSPSPARPQAPDLALAVPAQAAPAPQEQEPGSTPLPPPRPPETRPLTELLVVGPLSRPRRSPLVIDPVAAALVRGAAPAPVEGDTLEVGDGETRTWSTLRSEDGAYRGRGLRGGWAHARVSDPDGQVLLLEARGHAALFVDGVPRGGDVYSTGWVRTPFVARPEGTELLFRTGRGQLSAQLSYPPAPVFLEDRDATLPDFVRGRLELLHGSVVMVNATARPQPELFVTCTAEFHTGAQQYLSTVRVPLLQPLEARKLAVPLPFRFEFDEADPADRFTLIVSLHQLDAERQLQVALSQVRFPVRVRGPEQSYQTTYLSSVDGSAQAYAVQPAAAPPESRSGLVLSLHGAGVQARGQAESYAPKPWAHVVAPTNRRPFGFDWEDWGRIDALEVLDHASQRLEVDRARVHLSGHSMGGHGTWQLGVHATDRFAAIAPSAGWCDFWTYTGAWRADEDSAVEQMLARAANASRTALALENLATRGVYVLHGDADDNVPVREARAMRERLGAFHPDFAYYERPGAGHWWGAQCVDWPPLVDFLEARRVPPDAERLELTFTTVDPAVSSRLHWVVVEAQHRSLEPSRVEAELDPAARAFELRTANVSRLALDLAELASGEEPRLPAGQPLTLQVDGQELSVAWPQAPAAVVRLLRADPGGGWEAVSDVPTGWKGPARAGPFKAAFARQVLLVHATAGTPEENAWSIARARFDLDTWAYRGNGTAQLISDEAFLAMQPRWRGERNVVIYGHLEMNRAWDTLDPACPLEVRRGRVRVGSRILERDDLAVLFTYPRREAPEAAAAVVCGSGPAGQRLSEHLLTFTSGVAWPDWSVIAPEMLEQGGAGVLGAGFLGYDWTLERGQSAWQPGL